jgi:hypothetical protein
MARRCHAEIERYVSTAKYAMRVRKHPEGDAPTTKNCLGPHGSLPDLHGD